MPPRVKAFLIHLAISAFVLINFAFLVYWVWYPAPLLELQGGLKIIGILLLVDVLIGPTLTLIVFKKGKKTLVFDLSVIAILQLSAFLYGAWVIHSERPQYLTFAYDRFHVVRGGDLPSAPPEQPDAYPQWDWGPRLAYATLPINTVLSGSAQIVSLSGSSELALQPAWYRPYPGSLNALQNQSLDPTILKEDARFSEPAQALAQSNGMKVEDFLVFPVMGRANAGTALVAKNDGRLVGILNIRPWSQKL